MIHPNLRQDFTPHGTDTVRRMGTKEMEAIEQSAKPLTAQKQNTNEKHVYLLGTGPQWELCPFDKETWSIGKIIMLNLVPKRLDRIFSMDAIDELLTIRWKQFAKEDFIAAINRWDIPYVSSEVHPDIPKSIEFPLKEIVAKYQLPYFMNTIAYMIAMAIYEDYKHISLYGIAQMGSVEYTMERKCVEYWLGLAIGLGIRVEIKTQSALLKNDMGRLYGYQKTEGQLKQLGKL